MSQKVDLRVARTQILIRDAFIDSIIEVGFEAVTVKKIAEKARINRATFYRHYKDKYDLADRLTDLLFVDVMTEIRTKVLRGETLNWAILFEHVAQYAAFYRAMMGRGGIPRFREQVRGAMEQQILETLKMQGLDESKLDMPVSLPVCYLASAQVGFMQWWLENGMPFSPQQAATYLLDLHVQGGVHVLGMI